MDTCQIFLLVCFFLILFKVLELLVRRKIFIWILSLTTCDGPFDKPYCGTAKSYSTWVKLRGDTGNYFHRALNNDDLPSGGFSKEFLCNKSRKGSPSSVATVTTQIKYERLKSTFHTTQKLNILSSFCRLLEQFGLHHLTTYKHMCFFIS